MSVDEVIERNFNLDIKNPYVGDIISHDPEALLTDYSKQQADIQILRDQLKIILKNAYC